MKLTVVGLGDKGEMQKVLQKTSNLGYCFVDKKLVDLEKCSMV